MEQLNASIPGLPRRRLKAVQDLIACPLMCAGGKHKCHQTPTAPRCQEGDLPVGLLFQKPGTKCTTAPHGQGTHGATGEVPVPDAQGA